MSGLDPRSTFRARAAAEMAGDAPPIATTGTIMRNLVADSAAMLERGPVDARQRAAGARAFALDHLEELHDRLRAHLARRGVGYHRAATADDATRLVRELLGGARRVPKSKTMVGEEIGLTRALREAGIDVLETDIGEYIVDIEGRGPSHITAPALHLNRSRIRDLLVGAGADLPDADPGRLSRHVRDAVASFFASCDAAITGANTTVAGSGRIVAIENEGNVALGVSHPRRHIVVTGLEKVVEADEDALALLQVLAPSATAQPLTSFSHLLGDPPEGQERHIVFVDNGRSRILSDPRYRDVLRCIRCGACMNACPVYRVAGGLSFGSPYMGPIGAVLSPLLWNDGRYRDLPGASSLCGRCTEVCPVGIPLHRMLLDLRAEASGRHDTQAERAAWQAWAFLYGGGLRGRAAGLVGRAGAYAARWLAAGRIPLGAAGERREPGSLQPEPPPGPPASRPPDTQPFGLGATFVRRVQDLGVSVAAGRPTPREGDRLVAATAVVASTGSVLLTGDAASRRALLSAGRVIVSVDPGTIVRHPIDLAPFLAGGEDAVILTGASRTADIEKQIVRGIHGAEEMVVVLPA